MIVNREGGHAMACPPSLLTDRAAVVPKALNSKYAPHRHFVMDT